MQTKISTSCSLCHSSDVHVMARLHSEIDQQKYYAMKCNQCDLVFTFPIPDLTFDHLQAIYGNDYTNEQREISTNKRALEMLRAATHRQMEIVEQYAPKGMALNVGAMNGAIKVLEERGWQLKVVEVSSYAAKTARDLWNFDVSVSRIEDFQSSDALFDFIKLGHVIEHLANPCQAMAKLASNLKSGGLILIDTDNARGLKTQIETRLRQLLGEDLAAGLVKRFTHKNLRKRYGRLTPPEHLYAFSEKSLEKMLVDSGFEIIKVFKPAWGDMTWFPLADLKSFSLAERFFIKLDQFGARFGFGEVIAILARKR